MKKLSKKYFIICSLIYLPFLTAIIPTDNYIFEENSIKSHDGIQLYTLFFPALVKHPDNPTVIWVHGYGKHSHYHLDGMHYLASHGYNSISFDMREHGRTEKQNTITDKFSEASCDIKTIYSYYKKRINKNIFIIAHSLGGLMAIRHLQSEQPIPIRALVLSAPCLGPHPSLLPITRFVFIKMMSALFPFWEFSTEKADITGHATHDSTILDWESQDKLIVKKTNIAMLNFGLYHCEQAIKDAHKLSMPSHILMSESDTTVDNNKIKDFYHSLKPSLEKSLTIYHELYHSLLNELGREHIFETIYKRFQKYLASGSTLMQPQINTAYSNNRPIPNYSIIHQTI